MKAPKRQHSFLGSGWHFPPTFFKGPGGVQMAADEADIAESLRILLTTTVGERFLRPTYGCDLHKYLFEPLDDGLTAYIQDLVNTAILYHEPRIRLETLTLHPQENEGVLLMEIHYRIRATNDRRNVVFPFYKDEGTDVKR